MISGNAPTVNSRMFESPFAALTRIGYTPTFHSAVGSTRNAAARFPFQAFRRRLFQTERREGRGQSGDDAGALAEIRTRDVSLNGRPFCAPRGRSSVMVGGPAVQKRSQCEDGKESHSAVLLCVSSG